MKKQQEASPPYTLEDKKQLLIKMLKKKDAPIVEVSSIEVVEQPAVTGFQRGSKPASFKNDAEAEPQ